MFQSVGRILRWAKGYRRRMILGFVCSFFATWCTAGPVMLAAWALGRLIGNAWGENEISASLPWLCLVGITALILLRFLFTYWKNRLQESIGTERAADQRMELGDMLKRVSLGYFARNNLGDILTALTTELSTLELQSMNMVDAVINGYIQVAVILLCVAIFCPPAALVALVGVLVSAIALRGIGRQSARTAQELEKESLALQEKRSALLVQNGYPKDYLDPIYSCPRCRDTGWTDGRICECVQKLYRAEQTRELAPLLKQGDETFENFRLDYYSPVAPASGVSPRAQMERVLRLCRAYAESFGAQSPNLLFTGEPGLGKTFLSAAIARVVAAKGCGVAYDTASGLLASFEREKFSRDTDEVSDAASRVRQLMSCDLLILDDLGTEMPTAFTQSALYALLDGRLRAGKKTIVSTNLDRSGIETRYGAALASRLAGEYEWLEFMGRDIRAQRKEGI